MRNPGAGGRDGERESEKKMGRAREPLRQRVKENDEKRDRREEDGRAVDRRACEKKSNCADRQERPDDRFFQETMSIRRSWIFLIQRPVAQPVEEHGGGPRQDHACEHEEQCPQGRAAISRDQKRPQCKGKGEDRVRKTDQTEGNRVTTFGRDSVLSSTAMSSQRLADRSEKLLHACARAGENRCPVCEKHALESVIEEFS